MKQAHVVPNSPMPLKSRSTSTDFANTSINDSDESSTSMKLASAFLYASASFFIVVINKITLTSYKFPSFQVLGLGQITATIVLLFGAKCLNIITYPDFDVELPKRVMPLPLLYFGNLLFGLGGTKKINLPMFTVLRRFTILLTMIAEYFLLGVRASLRVQFCVFLMIFGALLAAGNDLAFEIVGYLFIFANDFLTAANSVYTKKKLNAKDLGKYGLLYYNSLLVFVPALFLAISTGDIEKSFKFGGWFDRNFVLCFLLSCVMGILLNYSIILCTHHNSALTTTIIGVLKNVLTAYLGMFIGGDYIFSWLNFVGINISVCGGIFYSYITFFEKKSKSQDKANPRHVCIRSSLNKDD